MKKFLVALTVAFLVLTVLPAGASAPAPGAFSTTGYTTNLVAIDVYPYLVPAEYAGLPGGLAKFHIQARGGPAYSDRDLCQAFYGAPCADLCAAFGENCGAHGYFEGSFAFDEWGLFDQSTGAGANDGLLAITTKKGTANIRFGGAANATSVGGSFRFLRGAGDLKKLAGKGTYAGNAGYIFQVLYEPCGGKDGPLCPAAVCAVRGDDLKLKNAKATWVLANDGEERVLLESLLLLWPEANGALSSVRLGGKTLATGRWLTGDWVTLDLGSVAARDREIRGGKNSILTLEFERNGISDQPADYTFRADFSGGCSAIHVAFP